jgi:hypothetical protein
VEDPSGVGAVAVVTRSTRGGGGGSMGAPLLLLLLAAAICARTRSPWMRNRFAAALIVLAMLPVHAQAAEDAWWHSLYATGTVSYADTHVSEGEMERAFQAQGIDSTVQSVDGTRSAWAAALGYQLSDHWSIEAGYLDLGKVEVIFDALATAQELAQVHPSSGHGATLAGVYRIPMGEHFSSHVRLGVFDWDSSYKTRTDGEVTDTYRDSGTDVLWGVGASYALPRAWEISLELQRIELPHERTQMIGVQVRWGGR